MRISRTKLQNEIFSDFDSFQSTSSIAEITRRRELNGFCPTCTINPVRLYDIQVKKFPIMKVTKIPRTESDLCFEGVCLVCHGSETNVNASSRNNDESFQNPSETDPQTGPHFAQVIEDEPIFQSDHRVTNDSNLADSVEESTERSSNASVDITRESIQSTNGQNALQSLQTNEDIEGQENPTWKRELEFGLLVSEMVKEKNYDDAIEILKSFMTSSIHDEQIQILSLFHLIGICQEDTNNIIKSKIISSNLHLDVFQSMQEHMSNSYILQKCCALLKILSSSNWEHCVALVTDGACQVLHTVMENNASDVDVVKRALYELFQLSSYDGSEGRTILSNLNCSQTVTQAMTSHRDNVTVQQYGCKLLKTLACNPETKQVHAVEHQEIEIVIETISLFMSREEVVVVDAFRTLVTYAREATNLRKLRNFTTLEILLEEVKCSTSTHHCQTDSATIMNNMKEQRDADKLLEDAISSSLVEAKHSHGNITNLIEAMMEYDWSEKVIISGLEALTEVAYSSSENRKNLVDLGAHQLVIDTMNRRRSNEEIQIRAFNFLQAQTLGY